MSDFLRRIPLWLRYGILLAAALVVLKTVEYQLYSYRFSFELYVGLLAVFFMLVGLATGIGWLNLNSAPKERTDESPTEPLTIKELRLLQGLQLGLTNQQLADHHYVSVNTVKTQLKSLYRKLGANSRAEALAKAKRMELA